MPTSLNPACPLCGLRYASKPLLELHIREDHRQRRRAQPGRRHPGGVRAASPGTDSLAASSGVASGPSRPTKEVTAMTATRRPRPGRVMTVPRRVIRALRHANNELLRASEAIIRSARAPQSRPQVQEPAVKYHDTLTERADRAA